MYSVLFIPAGSRMPNWQAAGAATLPVARADDQPRFQLKEAPPKPVSHCQCGDKLLLGEELIAGRCIGCLDRL